MPIGTVKFYDTARGYGFAALVDGDRGADVFVHSRALRSSSIPEIRAGDRIEFDVHVNDRAGPHRGKAEARNIRLLEQDEVRKAILAQANMSFRY
jgi:cold shock CspA family protein